MRFDISQFPKLENAHLVSPSDLRFSDNSRIYYTLKQLMRNGERLELELGCNIGIPMATIRPPENTKLYFTQNMIIYLIPEIEKLIMEYLLTGKCADYPQYPNLIRYTYKGDYNLYHLKREQQRGVTRIKKDERNGKDGYLYYAEYPYGRIEYGFYPFSPEYMKFLLASLEEIESKQ